ncbi:hypothetical protein HBN50_03435 [Halobacteriovorax sp. GB3]|uniref:hypothetical protein n=1 Tax=Halobacteriovorax sp. GB3 TaxID=2719615 RepID=UPI0023630BA1|nr:hypothetical protein [Halobacteriovorax sp. GB3]MDD0852130.1 hypothetical protein [Halobacteriovorax sp. GB3]
MKIELFTIVALLTSYNVSANFDFDKVKSMFNSGEAITTIVQLNEIKDRPWPGRCYQPEAVNEKLGTILYVSQKDLYANFELLTVISNYETYFDSMSEFQLLNSHATSFKDVIIEEDLYIPYDDGKKNIFRKSGKYIVSRLINHNDQLRYCIYFN